MRQPGAAIRVVSARLRRIALKQQGLLGRRNLGRGRRGVRASIERLGYLQIDTISVVTRAHHHTTWLRVGDYAPRHLNALTQRGEIFEYWFHAAAYLPTRDYRFALPRMHGFRNGTERWMRSRDKKLMRRVLDRVTAEGALKTRDFADPRTTKTGWWDWKPAKRALEQLFMEGKLMCVAREGLEKVYDLPERVLPSDIDTSVPTAAELAEYLLAITLRAHGFATEKSFNYMRPGTPGRQAVHALLAERLGAGRLVELALPSGEKAYGEPATVNARPALPTPTVRLLSPFDNAIIQRARTLSLFEFDYQLECYVTESERKFGYFCLPILYGDRFVGRVDCKAHRNEARFEVKALHLEHAADDEFPHRFAEAVADYARFNDCDECVITKANNRALFTATKRALAST